MAAGITTAIPDRRQAITSRLVRREPCPLCVAEHRDTAGDNLAVFDDGHTYCFGGHGLIKSINSEDFVLSDYTYEYLPWRGVTKDTMAFYDVKTKIDSDGKPISIGYPYPFATKVRNLEDKKFAWTPLGSNKPGLFGRDKFEAGQARYVTITEGEIDALSLYQALGGGPVVSVQSAATAQRDCAVDHDYLNSHERIYIALDGDRAGWEATRSIASLFDPDKVFAVRFTRRKDANDFLQAGEAEELKRIWWNSKHYLPENILSTFEEFKHVLDKPKKFGVPYPFPALTEMTYGIRTGEAVLITAPEKVGKTEVMHFIEHQLLKRTDANVASFFLEEDPVRHLHAIAGIELGRPVHLPDCECSTDEIDRAVRDVVGRDGRLHIYSHFGSDDPVRFLDTVRFLATARACKYILLDHISVLISGNHSIDDERKQLDFLSTKLEMMVKELDFALIIVSHVNDEGRTRGSRWLTKMFDITINLQRDLMHENLTTRNTTHLSVPLNRFSGRTGPAGSILFIPETYTYQEVAANDNTPEVFRAQPASRAA